MGFDWMDCLANKLHSLSKATQVIVLYICLLLLHFESRVKKPSFGRAGKVI